MANTPVLCFPHNPDQGLVAMAVKAGNWGSVVPHAQSSADFIYQAIVKLLNNNQTIQAVNEFSKKLKMHDTRNHWLTFLTSIANAPTENQILEEIK
jgi:UDP:flavonoid glycosyltransferase YjiC (YdhE family)